MGETPMSHERRFLAKRPMARLGELGYDDRPHWEAVSAENMRLPAKSSRWILAGLCGLSALLLALGERSRRLSHYARPVLVPFSHLGTQGVVHLRGRGSELTGPGPDVESARIRALGQDVMKRQEIIDDLNRKLAEMRNWRSIFRKPIPDPAGGPLMAYRCKLIDAAVIGGESLPARDRKLLWAGSKQGVARGDLAMTKRLLHEFETALPAGLTALGRNFVVGSIADAAGYSATLKLVTDPTYHSEARLLRLVRPGQTREIRVSKQSPGGVGLTTRQFRHDGRSEAPAVVGEAVNVNADGNGKEIVCRQVPAHHGVREGDMLTTARTAALPFRLTIGEVRTVEVDKSDPHLVTVYVKPLADLATLREVYIVLPIGRVTN